MIQVILGGVILSSFEVPASIKFGGAQMMAIHTLPGGERIIDTLGRSDRAISWEGHLAGPNATARAQMLDAMRVSGNMQGLQWDSFSYSVIIANCEFDYRRQWWVPYKISCNVLQDQSWSGPKSLPSQSQLVAQNINSAAEFVDVVGLQNSISGSVTTDAIAKLIGGVQASIQSAENMLQNKNLEDPFGTSACGSLAQSCVGIGYLECALRFSLVN